MEPFTPAINLNPTVDDLSQPPTPQPMHPSRCAMCDMNVSHSCEPKHMNRAHSDCLSNLINVSEAQKNIQFPGTYPANRWIDCHICAVNNLFFHCIGRKGLATHIRLKHPVSTPSQLSTLITPSNIQRPPPPLRLNTAILPPSLEIGSSTPSPPTPIPIPRQARRSAQSSSSSSSSTSISRQIIHLEPPTLPLSTTTPAMTSPEFTPSYEVLDEVSPPTVITSAEFTPSFEAVDEVHDVLPHPIPPPIPPPPAIAAAVAPIDRQGARIAYRASISRAATTTRALERATAANNEAIVAQAIAAVAVGIAPVAHPPAVLAPPYIHYDRAHLLSSFSGGLYSVSPNLRDPLRILSKHLLDDALSNDDTVAADAIGAFQLIPGLIVYSSKAKGHVLGPAQLLTAIISSGNISHEIFRIASSWQETIRQRPPPIPNAGINPEITRARIERLCKSGRFSSATRICKVLDEHLKGSPQPVQPTAEFLSALINQLHPADDDRDILPDSSLDPPIEASIQVTPDQLRNRIYRLNRDSSSGQTGWTYSAIKDLADDRRDPGYNALTTPPTLLQVSLTNLCNKMLRGEINGIARDLLVAARLNMVPKTADKFRPIRIECAVCRLFGAVASDIARTAIGPGLQPIQTGGGLRSGVEFGARMADLAFRQGEAIIAIDIQNAFNTVRHAPIFSAIIERHQAIARFFRWKYGSSSEMRDHSGRIVAHTRTGVGQGDPWGGLFFELGYQHTLIQLSELVKTAALNYNIDNPSAPIMPPGRVIAYEDDTQVMGSTTLMFKVAPLIAPLLAENGFFMNVDKSYIIGARVDYEEEPPEGFNLSYEGHTILGVPTGCHDFSITQTQHLLSGMTPPQAVLSLLSPRTALHLLLQCYNPRPAYLLRTTSHFSAVTSFAATFDRKICDSVAAVLQVAYSPEFQDRCNLPRKLGGLGLIKHDGMTSEKNQLLSRLAFKDFLALHYPSEYQSLTTLHPWADIRLGHQENLEDNTDLNEVTMLSLANPTARGILSNGMKLAYAHKSKKILDHLAEYPETQQKAAWMLSSSTNSNAFIHSTIGLGAEGYFSADEFRCAARARLGEGPSNDVPNTIRVCACGKSYDAAEKSLHALSCALNKGPRNIRHDSIRNRLFQLLKRLHPTSTPAQLTMEFEVGTIVSADNSPKIVRTDIKFVKGAETYLIDIAIVDPASDEYQKAPTNSHLRQDGAASKYEHIKRLHYARVNSPASLPAHSIIPFVIEASGRLGPVALLFIYNLCGTQTFLRSSFLSDISITCARTAGKMLKMTRDRFQGVPQGAFLAPMHG